MKSIEWIDRLIAEKNLPSDRQAALLIGMTASAISQHRKGHVTSLDDKFAYRMEEELGLTHGKIVLDQHAERASDPNISAMWRRLASSAAIFAVISVGYASFLAENAGIYGKLLFSRIIGQLKAGTLELR